MNSFSYNFSRLLFVTTLLSYAGGTYAAPPSFDGWTVVPTPTVVDCSPTQINSPANNNIAVGTLIQEIRSIEPVDVFTQTISANGTQNKVYEYSVFDTRALVQADSIAPYFVLDTDKKSLIAFSDIDHARLGELLLSDIPSKVVVLPSADRGIALSEAGKSITIFDMADLSTIKRIVLGVAPSDAVIYPPSPNLLLISSNDDTVLSVLDLDKLSIVNSIDLGQTISKLEFLKGQKQAIIGNSAGEISLIDFASCGEKVVWTTSVSAEGQVFADFVLSSEQQDLFISLLDESTGDILFKSLSIETQELTDLVSQADNLMQTLYAGPDGTLLLIANEISSGVRIQPVFTNIDSESFGGFFFNNAGNELIASDLSQGKLLSQFIADIDIVDAQAAADGTFSIQGTNHNNSPLTSMIKLSSTSKNRKNFLSTAASSLSYEISNTTIIPFVIDNIMLLDAKGISMLDVGSCTAQRTLMLNEKCQFNIAKAAIADSKYDIQIQISLNNASNHLDMDISRVLRYTTITVVAADETPRETIEVESSVSVVFPEYTNANTDNSFGPGWETGFPYNEDFYDNKNVSTDNTDEKNTEEPPSDNIPPKTNESPTLSTLLAGIDFYLLFLFLTAGLFRTRNRLLSRN